MRAIKYLGKIKEIDNQIKNRIADIEQLDESIGGVGAPPDGERVQTSKRADGMENSIIRLIELKAEAADDLIELHRKRRKIIKTIELLPEPEASIIYMVHADYMTYSEIADSLDRSYSYVTKKHSSGLKKLQQLLDSGEGKNEKVKVRS